MEKYKSKYTEHIMGAPAWSVVDNKGNVMAVFKTTAELDGEDKAKQLADEMNREAAMADIRSWDEKIYQTQCNVNKVAVALLDMTGMLGFSLNKKDLAGKFDIVGAYGRLIGAVDLLKNAVDELPPIKEIEKVLEILSGSNK